MKAKGTVEKGETFVSLTVRVSPSTHEALKEYCKKYHSLQSHAVVEILTTMLKEEGLYKK